MTMVGGGGGEVIRGGGGGEAVRGGGGGEAVRGGGGGDACLSKSQGRGFLFGGQLQGTSWAPGSSRQLQGTSSWSEQRDCSSHY